MKQKALVTAAIVAGVVLITVIAVTAGNGNDDETGVHGTVITYTDSGFSPEVLRVEADTTITIENESSRDIEFSSDPHPSHTANPEMNAPVLPPGESQTLHLTTTGDWGYHDHLSPGATGSVIVE